MTSDSNQTDKATTMTSPEDQLIVRTIRQSECQVILDLFGDQGIFWDNITFSVEMNDFKKNIILLGEYNGRTIASALVTEVAEGIHYISAIFVSEEHRGRGCGSRILDEAMKYVNGSAVLDSSSDGLHMYLKRGFVKSYTSVCMSGKLMLPKQEPVGISLFRASDFEELMRYDDKHFVRARSPWRRKCIKLLLTKPEVVSMVACDDQGNVVGYGCCIPAYQKNWWVISPLYADTPHTAEQLLLALGKRIPPCDRVTVELWTHNENTVELYKRFGLEQEDTSIRMYLGINPMRDHEDELSHSYTLGIYGF